MELSRELEVAINTCALPFTAVDDHLMVLPRGRAMAMRAIKKSLEDNHPSCIVGSISEVNHTLADWYLDLSPLASRLAIETFESEKASGVRSLEGSADRGTVPKQETLPCKNVDSKIVGSKSPGGLTKRKIATKNLLAELFQHPEFNEAQPNELPNGVVFLDMVRNLILAERSPLTGKTFCVEKELEKFFLSPSVKAIWLDSFWWIFHERYKPDKEIQNKLFDRIALNYASLLFFGPGTFYERAILKRLPMLLSKALYTSFCCCFSQSWLSTHEFKSSICDTMGLWFSGIYPSPQSYSNWNYAKLDPERHRREELMSSGKYMMKGKDSSLLGKDTSSASTQWRPTISRSSRFRKPHVPGISSERPVSSGTKSEDSYRTQDTYTPKEPRRQTLVSRKATQQVKNISKVRWQAESVSKQSHPACKNPKMEKYLFNVCAKSPLILHFLLRYTSMAQHGEDVLITRWEPGRMLPETSLTYRDIIRLVLSNMMRRRNRVTQLHQMHQQGWQNFDRHLRELWKNFQRELKNIDQKEAEMRKKAHRFIMSQSSVKPVIRPARESYLKEIDFILRRYHSRNPR